MFASRFLLHQNWLKGKCNVRTLEGHTQGTKFSVPVNFFELGSKLCAPFYPPNHDIQQDRPEHGELHALLFTTSVWVLLCPTGL